MPWVRFEDNFTDHPKVGGLSDGAFRLWIHSITYSNRFGLDGKINKGSLRLVCGKMQARSSYVRCLIDAGLWHDRGEFWEIHDILEYQKSAAEIAEIQEKRAKAGRKGGLRKPKQKESVCLTPNPTQPNPTQPHIHIQAKPPDSKEPESSPVFKLILKGGGEFFNVTQQMLEEWKITYPDIDVSHEIRKACQWALDNPDKRKTARGARKYLGGWLGRSKPQNGQQSIGWHPGSQEFGIGDQEL